MRIHLVTVESAEQFGEQWTIAPLIHLASMPNGIMMPMAGEALELRLPDGQVVTGQIVSFGISVWRDSDGNFFTDMDPADPYLTLTIKGDVDLTAVPPGTEIWLPDVKSASA